MVGALWRERSRWRGQGSDMIRGTTAPQHDVAAGSRGGVGQEGAGAGDKFTLAFFYLL